MPNNILHVWLTSPDGDHSSQWSEEWELDIVNAGFGQGDYFWQDEFTGYPERRLGKRDNELVADFMSWSGGFKPEECDHDQIKMYCNAALIVTLGFSAKAAFNELTKEL